MSSVVSPAFLSAAEVDELCAPLTQRHAQARHLCSLFGLGSLPRRPDGLPLIGRRLVEERLNPGTATTASVGFNWSK